MNNDQIKVRCQKCKTVQELGGGIYTRNKGKSFTLQFCVTCKNKQWCEWEKSK